MIEQTRGYALDVLNNINAHWVRTSKREIMVYASSDGNGSHHEELDKIKKFLELHGFFEFNRDFDRICGKGFSVFKETKS